MEAGYVTRTMSRNEVALAIEWAAQEGWNPGLHDPETFPAADPQGFFVGSLQGEPVASISVVKYEPGFAFLGLYIVRPQWRGRGLGWALWRHGMASAAGRQLGLDGVVAQQPNYRKSGFELAWRNVRYEGRGGTSVPDDAQLVDLARVPLSTVCAYDNAYFPPSARPSCAPGSRSRPPPRAAGSRTAGCTVTAWSAAAAAAGRSGPCSPNENVSPIACSSRCAPGAGAAEPVYLDLPEANAAAVALAKRHHMRMVFETTRMYTGRPPAVAMHGLYGVTTFELG